MEEIIEYEQLPVIALRGMVAFPHVTMHFEAGREKSIRAVDKAMKADQRVLLLPQRSILDEDPDFQKLNLVGTVAQIKQIVRVPGEALRLLVTGLTRARVVTATKTEPYLCARVASLNDEEVPLTPRVEAMMRTAYRLFEEFMEMSQRSLHEEMLRMIASKDPGEISDIMAHSASFPLEQKLTLLNQPNPAKRLYQCNKLMNHELDILGIEEEMQDKAQESMNKDQRDYFLREQIKAIRQELGEDDEDTDEYEEKIKALKLPAESEEKLLKEVRRLRKQSFGSSEATVIRNYLDVVLELPWNESTKERLNVELARKQLDQDHFGLQSVKKRILESLAVRQMAPENRGQILCLVGPPGVGKTSIASSIAKCLGRKLARISLGGVHDEAEIRGHRKTYIGAMPGRILAALTQAKSNNPLILFDEIDKLGSDYRGDPAAALLEVLDPEQNSTFRDNFLEIPFDLSQCMFITTANTDDTIPRPLLDRMEVIYLDSYTDEEKVMIAKNHLLPKQRERHGLKKTQLRVPDSTLREIISCYTRESGVRRLEQELAKICRRTAMELVEHPETTRLTVTSANLEKFLGVRKYLPDRLPEEDPVGLVNGLAWTSVGGEMLEVECNVVEGSGKLELTGNLGKVMQESVQAAMSYIRSRASALGIAEDFYKTRDIHVHFPEGAVPKDGPSAGITICTALVSALTGATVRRDLAMTGEISIRGRVLAIGGLKEKTMAALRNGIKTVIIPQDNVKDLEEIDQTVRKALTFVPARSADTVLETALHFPTAEAPVVVASEAQPLPLAAPPLPKKRGRLPGGSREQAT
ncbi:MAG: endopeptidase La [Oscillospiraceae bacterium]|nr:endopeptidase La [Oscillospiraceae bacterium]